jgi:prepilin-type processing-associated H-X9-DG protein
MMRIQYFEHGNADGMTYSRKRSFSFSLIELFVVIAIMMLLVNLLSPSLVRMHKAAEQVTCLKQQKVVYAFSAFYIEDNDSYFPFPGWWQYGSSVEVNDHESYAVNWNDLLSIYDGRMINYEDQKIHYVLADTYPNWDNPYLCPSDETTHAWAGGTQLLGGTYAYNTHDTINSGDVSEYSRKGIGGGINSVFDAEIESPSDTIYLSERRHRLNWLGGYFIFWAKAPSNVMDDAGDIHGNLMSNFLFADGHSAMVFLHDTYSPGGLNSSSDAGGMWTRQAD